MNAAPDDFAAKAASFAAIHARAATAAFVANVAATVDTIAGGERVMPVTVNDPAHENAWVCSPITTYARYAREENRRLVSGWVGPVADGIIGVVDRALRRADLDRAVSVNNWLLSTNLYPAIAAFDPARVTAECADRWPGHAVWFRSLNRVQHAGWLHALERAGFDLVPTRQVYLFDAPTDGGRLRHNLRIDLKRLATTPYSIVRHDDFTDADLARSAALYARLYMDKYSSFNPRYTPAFLAAWRRAGLVELTGFRDAAGVLQAVVGLFSIDRVMTAPIVGYDTTMPRADGLYRLLMAQVFATTLARDAQLNLSAGAPGFKRLRGCRPVIEYSAVWSRHLPPSNRRALRTLAWFATRVGVPVMRRFAL